MTLQLCFQASILLLIMVFLSPEAHALWCRMCPYFWIAVTKLHFHAYDPLTSYG